MCRKKKEGACNKCLRISFNVGLLLAFFSFMGVPFLHSYIATWNFLIEPSQWSLLKGVGDFSIGMFAILYFSASLIILWRFYQKRRLCRMDNCSFYIFTVGILVLATFGQEYIRKAQIAHKHDFNYSCAELALADNVDSDSFLADMNRVYNNANDLLCTADCPCGLRPFIRDDSEANAAADAKINSDTNVDTPDATQDDTADQDANDGTDSAVNENIDEGVDESIPGGKRSLANYVTDQKNGANSVRKCDKYVDRVYGGNPDKLWQYESLFEKLEEDQMCAGVCNGIDEKALDLFLFSNVNDGQPLTSCRTHLDEQISNNIWYFDKVYMVAVVMCSVMIALLVLLFICQVYLYCNKKFGRKGPSAAEIQRNRAKHGMKISMDDREEDVAPSSEVEVADLEGPKKTQQQPKNASKAPTNVAKPQAPAPPVQQPKKEAAKPKKLAMKPDPPKKVDSQVREKYIDNRA